MGKKMMFGEKMRQIRTDKAITLRELSIRTGIDVGYLSRVERCSVPPIQKPELLDKVVYALELTGEDALEFRDMSAIDNERWPVGLKKCEGFPLFVKTVSGKRMSEKRLRELTEFINKNY